MNILDSPNLVWFKGEQDGHWEDCCCKTCEPIQALVSGLAPKPRLARLLAMLQAYIDDSGRGQSSGDFVLAGFIAPVENWLAFGHVWQTVLNAPRSLTYLHTRKAMSRIPSGPFEGWNREECD